MSKVKISLEVSSPLYKEPTRQAIENFLYRYFNDSGAWEIKNIKIVPEHDEEYQDILDMNSIYSVAYQDKVVICKLSNELYNNDSKLGLYDVAKVNSSKPFHVFEYWREENGKFVIPHESHSFKIKKIANSLRMYF